MSSFSRKAIFLMAMALVASAALATEPSAPAELDWSQWQSLPVHDAGRVMPLDTFARSLVREICGRTNPRLRPAEPSSVTQTEEGRGTSDNPLFPGGKPRKFTASEVLFSWLVEPERWEDVPFLDAKHEALRRDLLEVPLQDRAGRRLKHVSPRQVEQAARARERLAELIELQRQARDRQQTFSPSEIDRQLEHLIRRLDEYRAITLDPKSPKMRRAEFLTRLMELFTTWRRRLAQPLALWQALEKNPREEQLVDQINETVQQLVEMLKDEQFSLAEAEKPVVRLCRLSRSLAALVVQQSARSFETDNPNLARQRRALMQILEEQTNTLLDQAFALSGTLFDEGRGVRVMPSLSPFALNDEVALGTRPQPWITLETLLFGSEHDLEDYPRDMLAEVREAFERAKSAYLDRQAADRPTKFAEAMQEFSNAMRALAATVEPTRRELFFSEKRNDIAEEEKQTELTDEELEAQEKLKAEKEQMAEKRLVDTAYPTPGALDRELFYNRLDPFLWAWILTLGSIVILVLGIGRARKPMFFIGAVVLTAGQVFTIVGLLLRASITGMVPVTNMYETVLFSAATVALLGLWFALLPITWPVISAAWRITAISAMPSKAASAGLPGDLARWFWRTMPLFRGILVVVTFYVLAIGHYNPSEAGPIFPLLPSFPSVTIFGLLGSLVIWIIGLTLLAWSIWFFPRAILTLSIVLTMAPKAMWILYIQKLDRPIDQVVARRPFVLAGAAVALLAYLLAYYVPGPVFHRDVSIGMAAMLRSNFWLALHVLIVTASYGAGALAWGLALISLGYYALGRYRSPKPLSAEVIAAGHRPADGYEAPSEVLTHRPPAICAKLAGHIYKTIQIAVLLLAAGTITGAIWADYAWGRYWGWDPKEVWALVSLLVYLVVLHGRWAGWTGNFGIAVGAVLGAMAILMTWYGVNFLLRGGLHSYGQGSGGEIYVIACVLANLILVAVATARYQIERHSVGD